MAETLRTSSEIVLFGREVEDVKVAPSAKRKKPSFVRVYGFSYDGAYYEVVTPMLILVDGNGVDASKVAVPGPNPRDKEFYKELKAWTCDMEDDTIRMDVTPGKLGPVLLETVGDGGGVSGARVSGARVAGARVSGARVSGARVSGARISGDASD